MSSQTIAVFAVFWITCIGMVTSQDSGKSGLPKSSQPSAATEPIQMPVWLGMVNRPLTMIVDAQGIRVISDSGGIEDHPYSSLSWCRYVDYDVSFKPHAIAGNKSCTPRRLGRVAGMWIDLQGKSSKSSRSFFVQQEHRKQFAKAAKTFGGFCPNSQITDAEMCE